MWSVWFAFACFVEAYEGNRRFLSLPEAQVALIVFLSCMRMRSKGRVIALSVCQPVSGYKNEHLRWERLQQHISNKRKNSNLHTLHKEESYKEL